MKFGWTAGLMSHHPNLIGDVLRSDRPVWTNTWNGSQPIEHPVLDDPHRAANRLFKTEEITDEVIVGKWLKIPDGSGWLLAGYYHTRWDDSGTGLELQDLGPLDPFVGVTRETHVYEDRFEDDADPTRPRIGNAFLVDKWTGTILEAKDAPHMNFMQQMPGWYLERSDTIEVHEIGSVGYSGAVGSILAEVDPETGKLAVVRDLGTSVEPENNDPGLWSQSLAFGRLAGRLTICRLSEALLTFFGTFGP